MADDSEGTRNKHSDLQDAAKKLGRRGGRIGGPARARKLTAERRKEIGKLGAEARWKGHKKDDDGKKGDGGDKKKGKGKTKGK